MRIQASILINLAAHQVFDCLSEFNLSGLWSSTVIETVPDPAPPQVGSSYKTQLKLLNQTWNLTYQVIEFERGRLLTFKTTSGWLPGLVSYRLEQAGPLATRLSYLHEFELVKAFKPYEALLQKSLARQAATDLANFKDWLESGLFSPSIFGE